ncbi:MAG TPA: hypothetical protein VMH84_05165 [Xanthobacteraceae bacterium]|nr:hypothetical protein [Xanthobacteraceae bacterium]
MWRPKLTVLIGALLLSFAVPRVSAAQMLISESEAKLPPSQDASMVTRGLTRGPAIEQISPALGATTVKSPMMLKIKFIARNNVDVDPASVKLTYLKVPQVDLSDRIKSYVTKDGITMAAAEVPPGNHVLRLDVKDKEGRTASSTITLTVVK